MGLWRRRRNSHLNGMSIPRVKQKTQQSPSVTVGTRRSDCFTFFPREKKNGRDGGGQGNIPTRDETTRNIVLFFKVRTQKIIRDEKISDGLFSSGISWTFRCCWLLWCLVEQDPVASQCRTDCSSVRKSYFLFFSGGECRIFLFFFYVGCCAARLPIHWQCCPVPHRR